MPYIREVCCGGDVPGGHYVLVKLASQLISFDSTDIAMLLSVLVL